MDLLKSIFKFYAITITLVLTVISIFTLFELRDVKIRLNEFHLEMDNYQYEVLGLEKRVELMQQNNNE